jgi:DNA-binding transcriptional regulator YhcF (GntR family)
MFKTVPLAEVKRFDVLGLLRGATPVLKQSTQTLAAMRRLCNKSGETFASVRVIAEEACLSTGTVRHHLRKLVRRGALELRKRQKRRTPTYVMQKDLLNQDDQHKFLMLPRWAAKSGLTWAERAVLAAINSRDALNEYIGDEDGCDAYGRLAYSASALARDCGISRQSAITAKAQRAA